MFLASLEPKKITFTITDEASSCRIISDPKLLQGVVQNLISNAIKYTSDGGTISVVTVRKDDGVIMRVSDTGRGIEHADQKNIFKKFFRSRESRLSPETGTGLGLSIASLFVTKIGGTIWFDSKPSEGTNFYVWFPAAIVTCRDKQAQ